MALILGSCCKQTDRLLQLVCQHDVSSDDKSKFPNTGGKGNVGLPNIIGLGYSDSR